MKISDISKDFISTILSSTDTTLIKKEEDNNTLLFLVNRKPFGEVQKRYQIYFCNKSASDATCIELENGDGTFSSVAVFLTLRKSLFAM